MQHSFSFLWINYIYITPEKGVGTYSFYMLVFVISDLNSKFIANIIVKKKKYSVIDDETLDKMKHYYKLENHDEILQYLRKNNVIRGDNDRDNTHY
jgi:hypothetical protein